MLYTVFGNPASKQLNDPVWGGTTKQFQNHLAVARYFNEEMGVATETLATLRGVIGNVTPDTDFSTIDKVVPIIRSVPPGGRDLGRGGHTEPDAPHPPSALALPICHPPPPSSPAAAPGRPESRPRRPEGQPLGFGCGLPCWNEGASGPAEAFIRLN
jgi:hypothetical protein